MFQLIMSHVLAYTEKQFQFHDNDQPGEKRKIYNSQVYLGCGKGLC